MKHALNCKTQQAVGDEWWIYCNPPKIHCTLKSKRAFFLIQGAQRVICYLQKSLDILLYLGSELSIEQVLNGNYIWVVFLIYLLIYVTLVCLHKTRVCQALQIRNTPRVGEPALGPYRPGSQGEFKLLEPHLPHYYTYEHTRAHCQCTQTHKSKKHTHKSIDWDVRMTLCFPQSYEWGHKGVSHKTCCYWIHSFRGDMREHLCVCVCLWDKHT